MLIILDIEKVMNLPVDGANRPEVKVSTVAGKAAQSHNPILSVLSAFSGEQLYL